MVKRTVLTRQCKKTISPKKQRKRKSVKRKSQDSTERTSMVNSMMRSSKESVPDEMVNNVAEVSSSKISIPSDNQGEANKEEMSESVILIDDISDCPVADESCFIIDVEPNDDIETSFYTFKNDNRVDEEKSTATVEDNLSSNMIDSSNNQISRINNTVLNEESSDSSSSSDSSDCSDEESDDFDSEIADKNNSKENAEKSKGISPQHVEMWNGLVDQMKNDGFLRENNCNLKRSNTDELAPNKRMACDSGQSKPGNWNVYKKVLWGNPSSANAYSSNVQTQNSLQMDSQNLTPKKLINKENLLNDTSDKLEKDCGSNSTDSDNCICIDIDNDSDSDIEFVEEFNPADRLIELSDDEGSVIIEEVIPLPTNNKLKRRISRRRSVTPKSTLTTNQKKKQTKKSKKTQKLKGAKKTKKTAKAVNEAVKQATTNNQSDKPLALRPIVIDGCNVAHGHGKNKMSVEGLKICYDYFHSRGHEVKIFLPSYRKFHPLTSNVPLLIEMEAMGIVIFTPGRTVNGKKINSYDDRFILEYATLKGAVVITRDNYRDLYLEKEEFRDTITNRLLQYTFVDDLIMFPDDPLGRNGPRLAEFLCFPSSDDSNDKSSPSTSKS